MEVREVDVAGNAALEAVGVELEGEEVGPAAERGGNFAGEAVVREIEAVEGGEGGGEVAGEVVVGEKEKAEGGEVGERGDGAVETVAF